jgi:putative hemolysin
MKKSSFYFLLSAIALSGVFGLTACSSTEEEVVDNPNYDPLTKTVNANFVFSVSTGNTASTTRQSSASAQATISEVRRVIGYRN